MNQKRGVGKAQHHRIKVQTPLSVCCVDQSLCTVPHIVHMFTCDVW